MNRRRGVKNLGEEAVGVSIEIAIKRRCESLTTGEEPTLLVAEKKSKEMVDLRMQLGGLLET